MPQMDASEQQVYGRYEGTPEYQQPLHDEPPHFNPGNVYDDAYMDAFAQRLSQRMAQGPAGKISFEKKMRASAGQRLALAIVSVLAVIMMTAIVLTDSHFGGTGGLLALGGAYLCIFLINAVFNDKA